MLGADYTDKGFFTKRSGTFVTYDRFLKEYWAHFPHTLTKRLGESAQGYHLFHQANACM